VARKKKEIEPRMRDPRLDNAYLAEVEHDKALVAEWMQKDERFLTMGCIVVTEQMMDVLEETFMKSGKKLTVITTNSVSETFVALNK
jgi:hypothetical protein